MLICEAKDRAQEEKKLVARFIVPRHPKANVFSRVSKGMTSLGTIMVATAANQLSGWKVEVIDENNYHGPCDELGNPDHETLQKTNPATLVGIYCGMSCTTERAHELADFYAEAGAQVMAGGLHATNEDKETLRHFHAVIEGDGEESIQKIMIAIAEKRSFADVPAASIVQNGRVRKGQQILCFNLDNLPIPDFSLLKDAQIDCHSIGRARGCAWFCDFCSVNSRPRQASAKYLFNVVEHLVSRFGAQKFFITDDLFCGEDGRTRTESLNFLKLIAAKYGNSLSFTVQIRLKTAEDTEFLLAMKDAGVQVVCIGFESPIDEDLRAMKKGFTSAEMVRWSNTIADAGFWIHGMFIFGYPYEHKNVLGIEEILPRWKEFIRDARITTIQVLHPIPLPGSRLRQRLLEENRIILSIPYSLYDGNFLCVVPDPPKNLSIQQAAPMHIMRWFYQPTWWQKALFIALSLFYPIIRHERGLEDKWTRLRALWGGQRLVTKWLNENETEARSFLEEYEEGLVRKGDFSVQSDGH